MADYISISYKGNWSDYEKIKVLASRKNMSVGALLADAMKQTYGEDLRIIGESLAAMNDRLNEHASKKTIKQTNGHTLQPTKN